MSHSLTWARLACFLLCLLPLARWLWLAQGQALGANPPEFLIRSSGVWALACLGATMAISPLRRLPRLSGLLRLRRMVGLFAFFYASLHVLGWALWEHGMALAGMWRDILQRTFILVGVLAYAPMLPMAVTSTNGWMRRLGAWWRRLHLSVHAVALLSLWHFWLVRSGKNDFADVWLGAAALLCLWIVRLRGRA